MSEVKDDDPLFFEPLKSTLAKHSEKIKELRSRIPEGLEEKEDLNCYRFLRGFMFDVDQASAALNKSLQWRKDNNVDELRKLALKTEYADLPNHATLVKLAPANELHGYDNKGQPIALARMGLTDPTALMSAMSMEQIIKITICNCEKKLDLLNKLSYEKGVILRAVRVTDLRGLGVKHMASSTVGLYRNVISVVQANYPEMLGALYYVNVPWMFSSLFALIKPLLAPATIEKLHFCSGDAAQELAKYMKSEIVPSFLGGQCKCGKCCPAREEADNLTKVNVPRGDKFMLTVNVPKPRVTSSSSSSAAAATDSKQAQADDETKACALVEWVFQTESNNIDFEVMFKSKNGEERMIVAKARVESHIHPGVSGHYECKEEGVLTFTWDNSFSVFSSKNLLYRVDVGGQ